MPGGRIVLIQTRWHEDDLSGWLLQEHKQEGWTVLDLPAISDAGEALWPAQYDLPALEQIRRAIGPRDWSALYQQRPAPRKATTSRPIGCGNTTSRPRAPKCRSTVVRITRSRRMGRFTVHAVIGLDPEGRMFLLDLWRRQASSDVWVEAFCDPVSEHRPLGWAEEQGQIKAGVGPFLERRMRERQAFVAREQFPTRGDKAVRAQSMRGRMALNGLYVPKHAPWLAEFRRELLAFPAGKHDDGGCVIGLIGQLLDQMVSGEKAPRAKPVADRWVDRDDDDDVNWKAA